MTESLTCESCQLTACPVVTDCKAGMVKDVCNCCAICAQSEGDECGGKFELNGKCGLDLFCQQDYNSGDDLLEQSAVGVCKSTLTSN